MPDAYEKADYYDCDADAETLSHGSWDEAIEYYLDSFFEKDCDVEKVILARVPITVTGFKRRGPDAAWIERAARTMIESFADHWSEEFGDPDRFLDDVFTTKVVARIAPGLRAWIRKALRHVTPWACEPVGTRTYTPDDVLRMMRRLNPQWFEKETA